MGDMDSLRSNSRRQFIEYFAGIGLSSTLLPGVLWADMQQLKTQKITKEMLKNAEEIAGLNFTDASSGFASTRILAGDAFIEIDSISSAFFTGADQALSRQAEEIQPSAQMRGH